MLRVSEVWLTMNHQKRKLKVDDKLNRLIMGYIDETLFDSKAEPVIGGGTKAVHKKKHFTMGRHLWTVNELAKLDHQIKELVNTGKAKSAMRACKMLRHEWGRTDKALFAQYWKLNQAAKAKVAVNQ